MRQERALGGHMATAPFILTPCQNGLTRFHQHPARFSEVHKKPRSSSPPRRPNFSPDNHRHRVRTLIELNRSFRSVLSVIDEAPHTKHVDSVLPSGAEDAVVDPAANGPSGARDSGVSWTSFPFGEHPLKRKPGYNPAAFYNRAPVADCGCKSS